MAEAEFKTQRAIEILKKWKLVSKRDQGLGQVWIGRGVGRSRHQRHAKDGGEVGLFTDGLPSVSQLDRRRFGMQALGPQNSSGRLHRRVPAYGFLSTYCLEYSGSLRHRSDRGKADLG
jgi:hypothetical protein